jgi:hypothetical protein
MQKLTLVLHSKKQAWAVIKLQVFPYLALWLKDGVRLVLTINLMTRSKPQNARYWGKGVLAQIAEQAAVNGSLFSAAAWHEQFKRQFIGVTQLPNGQVIGLSSTDLTTAEFSLFCTEVEAYAATALGVTFYDLERG